MIHILLLQLAFKLSNMHTSSWPKKNNPSKPEFLECMHQAQKNEELTASWWLQSSVVSQMSYKLNLYNVIQI